MSEELSDCDGRDTHSNRNTERFYEFEPGVLHPPNRYRGDRRSSPISTVFWIGVFGYWAWHVVRAWMA